MTSEDSERVSPLSPLREGDSSFSYSSSTLQREKNQESQERERLHTLSDKLTHLYPNWRNTVYVSFISKINAYRNVVDVIDQLGIFTITDLHCECQEEYERKLKQGYDRKEIEDLTRSKTPLSKLCSLLFQKGLLEFTTVESNLPKNPHIYYNPELVSEFEIKRKKQYYTIQAEVAKKSYEEVKEEQKQRYKAQMEAAKEARAEVNGSQKTKDPKEITKEMKVKWKAQSEAAKELRKEKKKQEIDDNSINLRCLDCGHDFNYLTNSNAKAWCPKCRSQRLGRVEK